ncbi:glycosyltransferase family 4 protein [bacterium]|nr:glycosyltransferase family 4 protein [bacterium]
MSNRLKILIIAPTPFFADRGTHIRILEEALALERRGHFVSIATYHIGKNISKKIKTNIKIYRIPKLLFWCKKMEVGADWRKVILNILLIFKTLRLVLIKKPDIIHAHLHEGALIGLIVQKILFWKKIKLVADFHGTLTKEMVSHNYLKNKFLRGFFIRLEKFINNLGDFAIASSGELADELRKTRKDGKIETILDGVNLENYDSLASKKELRKEMELPADKIIVVYTGSFIANKGIGYLLEAVPEIAKKNKNIYFVLAGFPAGEVKEYTRKNNLENRVKLISPLSYFDLPKILKAGDIGVDPKDSSVRQASGKILQYMGAGLPVVCFNRANNRKYLKKGAYYANNISARGIADGILYFSRNSEEIIIKGKIAKERSVKFSWDKSAEKIEEIYRKI